MGQIIGLYYQSSVSCYNEEAPVSSKLIPPFTYSNECTSALIKNYAPVLVFSFSMMLFFTICQYLLLFISKSNFIKKLKYIVDVFSCFMFSNVFSFKDEKDANATIDEIHNDQRPSDYGERIFDSFELKEIENAAISKKMKLINDNVDFLGAKITCRLMVNFVTLLSFGLASPLLGFIIGSNIIGDACLYRLFIGRHIIELGKDLSTTNDDYQILDDACGYAYNGLISKSNSLVVLFTVSWFWGFIILDMIGDLYGRKAGVVICFSYMAIFPISVYILLKFTSSRNNSSFKHDNISNEKRIISVNTQDGGRVSMAEMIQNNKSY